MTLSFLGDLVYLATIVGITWWLRRLDREQSRLWGEVSLLYKEIAHLRLEIGDLRGVQVKLEDDIRR